MADIDHGPAIGGTLPQSAVSAADGTTVLLRPSVHRATVLVLPHAGECEECRTYLGRIHREASLQPWSASLLTVVEERDDADFLAATVPVVAVDGELRHRCRLADGHAAVLVTDRHGQIWERTVTDDHGELPGPAQLEQDVRFIAIQCPECDVPDIPGLGEWA